MGGVDIWTAGSIKKPSKALMRVWPFRWPYMYPFVVGIQVRSCIHIFCHIHIFTRAPHQAGMHSLHQTMNPHFFFPRLHHAFHMWCRRWRHRQHRLEVHGDRVGEKSGGVVQLSHGACFFRLCTWTPTTSLSDLSTLFLWRKKPTSRPSRPFVEWHMPLTCSFSSKLKCWSNVRVGFPASGSLSRLASSCSVVRGFHIFSLKKTSLPASVSLSDNPVEKSSFAVHALSPIIVFAMVLNI